MRKALFVVAMLTSSYATADTLYEAVQYGMIANPDILLNTAKGLSAKQAIDKAKGGLYPSIDVTGGFGRQRSINPTSAAINDSPSTTLNIVESAVELRQRLFAGGGIINEVKRNQYLTEAQKWKTQGIAEDLALEITKNYFAVLLHERLYAYSIENLKAHKAVFKMIKERADAGITRTAEVDQANARLALAEANKISALADLQEVKINYAKTVGKWPENLQMPHVPARKSLPNNLARIIEKGLDNHPTVKSSYADIKEAKAQYDVARAAYYPEVNLVLNSSKNKNLGGLIGPNDSDTVAVRMNYNAFRGGADAARIRETAYQVQEAYETKNRTLLELKETIRLAWNAYVASALRIQPLKQHVTASRKTRTAYQDEFKVGKRTLLDLLDSQNEYYQSQIELARAENDEILSRYRILNGMGCLLKYLNLRLPVNVVNNDVFSSAQTNILLNRKMDEIPYPNNTDNPMVLTHPVKNMEKTRLTKSMVDKNTTYPQQITPKLWYISAGSFRDRNNAIALVKRLNGLGFTAFMSPYKDLLSVFVGPYEYRGHAGNGMERLKELAHVEGVLVTFKEPPKKA
ncbi:TPA: TolC family outer membrane protein [Legionella pneumophila subsp. pneumophila]|uniref:TolC family outer membrane protein n=1 Tax=Legionella pneumophila TaxID=446 RepID=UPI001A2F26AE|nr:TolC family outer membrane protein [Legionella pneumophila]HAT9141384.1 TolC family outer membrane protein [Legionella pneumophila subsp. pneumophila]WAI62308.1 TolC family outer membrane protein [Legionella pneumophila]HAT9232539.1 TolC family outer membrane protein [Legionella pneumophila subsp. pneumophila]HAT9440947.1 TolC family outer membrane protein [Legionella pneumophila subsp. pneumophila]HAT9657327.1 TolC family outer membrane protein [Legionella pneumophila subsp. pneumophila]